MGSLYENGASLSIVAAVSPLVSAVAYTNGFERGTRLAARLHGAVELGARVVVAADQREDLAVRDVEREEGAFHIGILVERDTRGGGRRRGRQRLACGRFGVGLGVGLGAHGVGLGRLGLRRQHAEARDVADRERLRDLGFRCGRPLDVAGARPRDVGQVYLAAEVRGERDVRDVLGVVVRGDDAEPRLRRVERSQRRARRGVELVLRSDALELCFQLRARHAAHGSAPALAVIERLDARAQRRFGRPLQVQVERRLDAQPALQHGLAAEFLEEMTAHFFGEPCRGSEVRVLGRDPEHGRFARLRRRSWPRR